MKTSKVLKIAKQRLSPFPYEYDGKEKFICIAIQQACNDEKVSINDYGRCRDEIQRRLNGAVTLERWLRLRGHIPEKFLHNSKLMQRIQDHRHAWLDSMIAEYEAQGD